MPTQRCAALNFDVGAPVGSVLRDRLIFSVIPGRAKREPGISRFRVWSFGPSRNDANSNPGELPMLTLQPAEWSKPRGFSHGVAVDGPGRWIVLAGQTGGDEKGEYQSDLAGQVSVALRRIIKLLGEAGAGPEHIVRLTWYLTSRSEYEAAGAGIGAAWRETLGRNFPPSTLLYIEGLVDIRAKVEIEVTAFVPTT
jgi:enamine deaminase RidA (YjgF/YER057c/UK114 family)